MYNSLPPTGKKMGFVSTSRLNCGRIYPSMCRIQCFSPWNPALGWEQQSGPAVHKAMAQRKRHATQGTGDMLKPTTHTGRVVELNFGVGDFWFDLIWFHQHVLALFFLFLECFLALFRTIEASNIHQFEWRTYFFDHIWVVAISKATCCFLGSFFFKVRFFGCWQDLQSYDCRPEKGGIGILGMVYL